MTLQDLQKALAPVLKQNISADFPVTAAVNRSADVTPGAVFCAIRGAKADGHDYIADALQRGASALCVSESWQGNVPENIPVLRVSDSYYAWGILCEEAAQRPADSMNVHTVTGTNGKTTIAFILYHILSAAGRKSGLLSTVLCDTGDGHPAESFVTMPDAARLQKLFAGMKENHCTDAVMESSSHGLHQHRAGALKFSSAIFTNLTGDHLDYHGSMEHYYQAKKALFTSMLAPDAPAVIHTTGEYGKRLFREINGRKLEYSGENPRAFCFLKNVTPDASGSCLEFVLDGRHFQCHSPLRGLHNADNLLEALSAAYALGVDMDILLESAEKAPPAPGRLEPVPLPSGGTAFVDYAHTDDALSRVLDSLRKILPPGGRLLTVFGCGGDRDRTKRPRMGKAAAEHSDYVFVTSDNPRTEDPEFIISEILPGIPAGTAFEVIPDRAGAIRRAVSLTGKNDLLLVAGKGHETYQEINGIRHSFDDREQIRCACR